MTIETKKAANINEAIQIINSLLPNGTFEFVTENHSDDYKVTYRHFGGTNEFGATCFGMIESFIDGKLVNVRFVNTYRRTAVDIEIENFTAEIETATDTANNNTATDANEEIINCTDDIIITADAYTQMIRTELANAQIASGNYGIQINGEWIYFTDHKITHIDAEDKLGFSFEYTLQGRKQFRHNNRVVSRDSVIKFFENKETAKAQEKSFREFFIDRNAPHHGFFQVQISPTFVDSCEHNYSRYFEYYNDAINFVNNAIEFCGNVPTHITIKRDKQAGIICYHRMPDGTVHIDKPDTDFFKHYPADEIQARIFDIDRAIKENTEFKTDCVVTQCNISRANTLLAVRKNFYEFILHEHAPATDDELDGSEEDDFTDELPALFPADEDDTEDELIDPPEIDKTATADSLTRAMTIALEKYQYFCLLKNLTGAEYELKLYNICRNAMTELWKGEAA